MYTILHHILREITFSAFLLPLGNTVLREIPLVEESYPEVEAGVMSSGSVTNDRKSNAKS